MHIINLLFIGGSLDRHISLKHSAVLPVVGGRTEAGVGLGAEGVGVVQRISCVSIGKSCPEKRGRLEKKLSVV